MPMYIGQSRYKTYWASVNGLADGENKIAGVINGTIDELSNDKVEHIKEGVFQSCVSLTNVDFPNCTSIGDNAFEGCTSLATVSFPKCTSIGSGAFSACTSLLSASFPSCVTIGKSAFAGLKNPGEFTPCKVENVHFPKCLTIGAYAFGSCRELSSVNFNMCEQIGSGAFDNCLGLEFVAFPKCTTIGGDAFDFCLFLSEALFPACKSVGYRAFRHCDRLPTIELPNCTEIGSSTFANCSILSFVNLPKCTNVGDNAFGYCGLLGSVSLPKCTTIGKSIFDGCTSLTEINLPSLSVAPSYAFEYCSSVSSASLLECTIVDSYAFKGCYSLNSVKLPKCSSIGTEAFALCSSLASINLPACTSIGNNAFLGCRELSVATFSSLSYIGSRAFSSCTKLMNLTNHYSSVASLYNTSAFYATPISVSTYTGSFGSIYVPASLVSLYKTATNWAAYADRIAPLDCIDQIDDVVIGYNLTKSIIAPLIKFESIPENISVVSNNENIVVSNIQATTESITFDITSSNTTESVECSIEATYNEKLYTMTFGISVVHPIDINSMAEKFGVNRTISTSIPYYGDSTATGLSVTSSDESRLSISNAQLVDNAITFDATTYDVEGEVSIAISITYGGKTYSQTKAITISRVPIYTIEDLGTTYGFVLNDNGYYESNNKGVQNSFAICKVNISAPMDCTMYLDCINYAEANFDYGILSNLDTTLSLSFSADSSYKKSFMGSSMATVQTVSYDITAGEHFIYVKYRKDNSSDSNNDSLQFAVRFE